MTGKSSSKTISDRTPKERVTPTQSQTSSHSDNVNHPAHYNRGKIEVIDFIEDQRLGFHLGNVVKYICRESKTLLPMYKMGYSESAVKRIEDLKKAAWYLQRTIQNLEATIGPR
jgi:hypothetical protein